MSHQRIHRTASVVFMLSMLSVPIFAPAVAPCLASDAEDKLAEAKLVVKKLEKQRRQEAKEELERLRKKLDDREARVKCLQRWKNLNFEMDERRIIPKPRTVSRYLQRQQRQRETTKFVLLQFAEQSRGEIKSGAALNFFLDECGPAAFELVFCKGLKSRANQPFGGPNKAEKAAQDLEEELLSGLSSHYVVDGSLISHVRYRRGLVGHKLTGRINQEPLDLERLPSLLRAADFEAEVAQIRNWRDHAMKELRDGQPVSAKTAEKLMDAATSLLVQIRIEKKKRAKQGFEAFRPYLDAERHMTMLFSGASRLIEAYQAEDVLFEEFKEGNIEELLAYMHRNNLHFAAADANGEAAYHMLYELIVKYYLDLRTMRQALVEAEQEVGALRADERRLLDIQLGVSLNNFQKTDIAIAGIGGMRDAINAYTATQKRKEAEARNP